MNPELKQQLELAEVEDAFIAAKQSKAKDPEGYAATKAKLHKARTAYREQRGTSVASTIDTKAKVN